MCSLNLCALLISFDNTNFLTWCDWCLLHTALSSQLVHVHRGSWDAGWKKWQGIKRSVWMCLMYCRIKGVLLRKIATRHVCRCRWLTWKLFSCLKKRLQNLYSTSTHEQACCCTLSAQIPRILHILLSNLFTHPNNSLYTPQHSVRNLTSAIDFEVGISCHQLATCHRRIFLTSFNLTIWAITTSPILALSNNPIEMARLRNGKSSPVLWIECATLCKRIQNSQCIAAVEIESTQKVVAFLQKFNVASFLQYASQLLMTCKVEIYHKGRNRCFSPSQSVHPADAKEYPISSTANSLEVSADSNAFMAPKN